MFVKSQNYEPSRKMAVTAVALSGPGEMERLGSISAFIFHNNVYKKYCDIKKMIMKYGEIQKSYVLFSDYI